MIASAGKTDRIQNVSSAVLNALERAVDIVVDIGSIRVVFETDSELLALVLNRCGQHFSQLEAPLDELKFQLRSCFSCSEVATCRRRK